MYLLLEHYYSNNSCHCEQNSRVRTHIGFHLEEARCPGIVGDHPSVPASPAHQVHLALLVVELHVEERRVLPAFPRLLLNQVLEQNLPIRQKQQVNKWNFS